MIERELYMQRALDLAKKGMEWVSPNPMVGCVIVHNNVVIGEGYHEKYGNAHAEVNAIESVKNKALLSESELYVNLEPCTHFGKTPPCVDLIIEHKLKKVIVCNQDPNPLVGGQGLEKLRAAGIEVEIGILSEIGQSLNRRFFKAQIKKKPYITLKWAESANGYIANSDGAPCKISNEITDLHVHKWRSEEDAILVGSNTVLMDNPQLNVRHWSHGKNPTRIIVDRELKLKGDLNIFDQKQKTIILNAIKSGENDNLIYLKIDGDFLQNAMLELFKRGYNSILVEGGTILIEALIKENLYDEIRQIKSTITIKNGVPAPKIPSGITLKNQEDILNDTIRYYQK